MAYSSSDGNSLWQRPYTPAARPLQPTSRPLGVGATGGAAEIRELSVYRDLYLLDATGRHDDLTMEQPLGKDEYFAIGDNVPVSVDSRHWAEPGLPRTNLIGRVMRPFD